MRDMGKHYTSEEKNRALRLVREELQEYGSVTKACSAVSSRLGISKDKLRGWYRRDEVDQGHKDGVTTVEREEIRTLKAKVRRLEEDNEILRRAAVFFAGELDPRGR
jgi:transposase-like protein